MIGNAAATVAFDRLAASYDELCANEIFAWMRREVQARFLSDLNPGARVLEIGCGAGHDSAWLAARGIQVVSCDPAPGMIQQTQQRVEHAGVAQAVTLATVGAERFDEWLRTRPTLPHTFDVLFSNFGALNCVGDLGVLQHLAARRLVKGGRVVICLMSRVCAWEVLYHLLTLRPALAARRWGRSNDATPVSVAGVIVPTYYHSCASVARALEGVAVPRRVRGLPIFLPPPYLERIWRRLPNPLQVTTWRLEAMVAERAPFNRLGDHVVLEFERQ